MMVGSVSPVVEYDGVEVEIRVCCSGNVIKVEAMFACYGPCRLCLHGGLFVDGVPLEVGVEVA